MGFTFLKGTQWGQQTPEPYDTGKDHFIPQMRDVFIGTAKGGFYVTSHLKGKMRQFRCRTWFDTDVGNIFGGGSTLQEAISEFVANFLSKTYNIRQ